MAVWKRNRGLSVHLADRQLEERAVSFSYTSSLPAQYVTKIARSFKLLVNDLAQGLIRLLQNRRAAKSRRTSKRCLILQLGRGENVLQPVQPLPRQTTLLSPMRFGRRLPFSRSALFPNQTCPRTPRPAGRSSSRSCPDLSHAFLRDRIPGISETVWRIARKALVSVL
jgi:hypothetical protein